jgi:glutamate/tyrosine decarboxylase-like PLP-dependent enzyme
MPLSSEPEPTLDPANWEEYRAVSHRILDELLDFVRTARQRPVWRPVPEEVKERLRSPAPSDPRALEDVWQTVRELILPYPTGNIHPRFFGWVHGTGTIGGVIAEMVAAAMNSNLGGREHVAVYVERQVVEWAKAAFGFPARASGILVTGTSMATVIALAVGRNTLAGFDVRARGLSSADERYVVYTSCEAHVAVRKALELIGLGADSLHLVPVDPDFRMDVAALRRAIAKDRAQSRRPLCVVGTAGTVNTGAIDDLGRLADIAAAEGVWLHVDGGFGALAALSRARRPLVAGIERADSLAFDFHKWLHVPYAVGCVLVRDGEAHRASFSTHQTYLATQDRGLAGGAPWFCDFGPDLSRGFAALKVWFAIQEHGLDRLAAMIDKNCGQAEYLAELVSGEPRLELRAPVSLNVVCFRYAAAGLDRKTLDRLNQEIIYALHEAGVAAPSSTRLADDLVIRVAITNHRTRRADLDLLVASVCALGDRIAREMRAASLPATD